MSLTRLLATLPEPLFSTYALERVLGVGAYAVVYQIRDKCTSEAYALKVIEKEPMKVRLLLDQLDREVAILELHADTPHVVPLLDVTRTATHILMRFELCNTNMEDVSSDLGPMREEEAFRWLREACLGVQHLHGSGVIHRDLKPANLLVDSEGVLCLCDFGGACFESQMLTGVVGTPEYSAPETSPNNNGVHTAKADIFGLGASLQHLLLGRPPKGPQDLPKGLSAATSELLAELMDPEPEARPSIEELLARPQFMENTVLGQFLSHWYNLFDVPAKTTKRKNMEAEISCGLGGLYY